MTHAELKELAKEIALALESNKSFRRLVKELVLEIIVFEDEQRRMGAVKAFLSECRDKHIEVSLTEEDRLHFDYPKQLGASLEAVLTLHRADIVRFLKNCEHVKRMAQERLNGRK